MIFGRDIVVACYTGQEQHRRFRWNVICDGGIGCHAKSAIDSCSPTYAAFHRFPYASRSNFLGNSDTPNRVQVIYFIGALGEIRTPDPQIRSLMLYPAELRARARPK